MITTGATVSDEHALEFLLAFDGRVHHLDQGFGSNSRSDGSRRHRSGRMDCVTRSRCTIRTAGGLSVLTMPMWWRRDARAIASRKRSTITGTGPVMTKDGPIDSPVSIN